MAEDKKQRHYGKVEMILDIINCENHSGRLISITFDDVVKWSRFEEREIEELRNIAYYMDPCTITGEMSRKIIEDNGSKYFTAHRDVIRNVKNYGHLFAALLARDGESMAYETIFKLVKEEDTKEWAMLKELLMVYARRLVSRIYGLLHEYQYPFNVIDTVWLKGMVTEEQFKVLVNRFGLNGIVFENRK